VVADQPRNIRIVFHGKDGLLHGCIVAEGGRWTVMCGYHSNTVHTTLLQDDETRGRV
jgi:hypothetical protein